MGLSNILAGIQTDLVAQLAALPQFASLTFKLGGREIQANDAPPRIAWVRQPGTYGPAEHGVRSFTQGRILRTHLANVDAHVWALPNAGDNGDDSDTELLAHQLVASAYRTAHGSFEVLGDVWPQPEWMTSGYLCVVSFRFKVPVTDTPLQATTIAGPPITFPFDQSTAPPPAGQLQAPGDT